MTLCYGLALAQSYYEGSDLFRVSENPSPMPIAGWPIIYASWLMAMIHLPLPAYYYWSKSIQVNPYFSNESVFKVLFTTWYGTIALLGFLATAYTMQYGWLLIVSLVLAGFGLARRGLRLRQVIDYGSTCASLFVFYLASDEVPATLRWHFYVGIGVVQCAFLALLEMVFAAAFSTTEEPGCATLDPETPPLPPDDPQDAEDEPPPTAGSTTDDSIKTPSTGAS